MAIVAHRWNLTPTEAVALQRELAAQVRCEDDFGALRTIAGVDTSMERFSDDGHGAIVVLSFPEMAILEVAEARLTLPMPYVPGLLSFREAPIIVAAWEQLKTKPDLLMVDGQGIAHPRGLGIASHVGLLLDVPTVGVAKSILCGTHGELAPTKGSTSALVYKGKTIGFALRTKDKVNPVFVSCGHRVGMETAVALALSCARGYRIPEPTRQAHLAANVARKRVLPGSGS